MQTFDPTAYLNEIRQKIDGMTKQKALEFLDQSINNAKGVIEYHKAEKAKAGEDKEEVLKIETANFQKYGTFDPAFYEPQKIGVLESEREKFVERNPGLEKGTESTHPTKDFTERRQLLAIYYLLNELGIDLSNTDKTNLARFARFLTNKPFEETKIKNTTAYKEWGKFNDSSKQNVKDLVFLINEFQNIGLQAIARKIQSDLDSEG